MGAACIVPGRAFRPLPPPPPDGDAEFRKAAGGRGAPSRKLTPPGRLGAPEGHGAGAHRGKAAAEMPSAQRPRVPQVSRLVPAPRTPRERPRSPPGCSPRPLRPALAAGHWLGLLKPKGRRAALPRTARAARHRAAPAFRPRRRAAPGQVTRSPW